MVKPSERLGNYEVASAADGSALILGSGAGGVTYRGRHIHLGTEVALKVLIRRKNLMQKDRDAFLSEARSAASLNHPQIARILDFGESAQQHPYYVMELCEGGSLEEFGRKFGPPDESTCVQWLFESAAALAHAHQKGILHRDIKPSNLLVAQENETATIKLIDFGLADHAGQTESADHVIGTPHFAAPEQLRGNAVPASDVFSLGATFLWLLTGKHLSQGDVKNVIAERLEAASYTSHLTALPVAWQMILSHMLDVDPAGRPHDGGELLNALQMAFPNHSSHPVAWGDPSADFTGGSSSAPAPSQWVDRPDAEWSDLWSEAGSPSLIELGVAVRATKPGDSVVYDVSKFSGLSPEISTVLTEQADLVARHAVELGLDPMILERGGDWWSIAWPVLGADDALSWVRQGQSASTAEILAALDPIATALDGMKPGGFEHLEIHPAMLIVSVGPPLKFSLAVPLPVLASNDQATDSAGTMRGALGASLSARFASCVYQLLSGRSLPPAAFVNARAYQAIPKLTERSNRFLASAIAGAIPGGTCRDALCGLAQEERIPGASYSGSLSSGASLRSRSISSFRSNPAISIPAPAVPLATQTHTQPSPPLPSASAVVPPAATVKRRLPAIAAGVLLVLTAGTWMLIPKSPKSVSKSSVVTSPGLPAPALTPESKPVKSGDVLSVVKVPGDASSISEALKICASGGTVEIAGGTYSEAIILTKSVSLISKSAAVIEDSGLGSSLMTVRGPIQANFRNIQLKNSQRQAEKGIESSPSLVLIADGANVGFEGCVIEGALGHGVSLADKASATFSNCRIRKNRGTGINLSSGAKVELSLSEVQQNGWSGIAASNAGTTVTLGSGATISANSKNGVEVGNGSQLRSAGAEMNGNQKVGLMVEGGGSFAQLESASVISGNHKYGIGVRDSGRLVMSDSTVEDNSENGIYVESGGRAEIQSSRFKSNGTIGVYLVGGSTSSVTISKSEFGTHGEAGVAFVEGIGKVTGCRFSNNPMALFYGKHSSGTAAGNSIYPGPVENSLVIENAGEVVLSDNVVATEP